MYTKQALRELGVKADTLRPRQLKAFNEEGYIIIENVLSAAKRYLLEI